MTTHPQPGRIVIHLPHASTVIPRAVREQFVLTDADLEREVRLMTDHFTDDLFALEGTVSIRHRVSRLVVDPERFERDEDERMSACGLGVVYTHTAAHVPLRRGLDAAEREALLDGYYRPHHAALRQAVSAALDAHGDCLVVDAHSFPARPLPYETDQRPDRPDICVGTDSFHTPPALRDLAVRLCERAGWSVQVNWPFDGALVPSAFHRRDSRVRAVMIEVNRRLYLEEDGATRSAGYAECRARIRTVLAGLAGERLG